MTAAASNDDDTSAAGRLPAVELAHVTKTYPGGVRALDDVSLTVPEGIFLAVMEPSGSGNSTLMHCAAGLDTPTSGSVLIDGRDIVGLDENHRTELRRERVGFVFQSYNLIPSLSVEDNITLLAGTAPARRHASRPNDGSFTIGAAAGLPPGVPGGSPGGGGGTRPAAASRRSCAGSIMAPAGPRGWAPGSGSTSRGGKR